MKSVAIVAVLLLSAVVVTMYASQQLQTQAAVLYVSMEPTTPEVVPIAYESLSEPPPITIPIDAYMKREFQPPNKEFTVQNGTRDIIRERLGPCELTLSISIQVYANNGSLLLQKTLTLDGGVNRTFKIYKTNLEAAQPLKVVVTVYIKLVTPQYTYENTIKKEIDGVTVQ